MNAPFEWAPLFTAEKFNERPGLNECPLQTRKRALIWKFAMSAEALIQIVCKNDETRVFFSHFFSYSRNLQTHSVIICKLRRSYFPFCYRHWNRHCYRWCYRHWNLAICHKQTFYLVLYILFSLENDMLTSTYFAFS